MSDFGKRGECVSCGRDVAVRAGLIVRHKDTNFTEDWCEGAGTEPKAHGGPNAWEVKREQTEESRRMVRALEAWERRERELNEVRDGKA